MFNCHYCGHDNDVADMVEWYDVCVWCYLSMKRTSAFMRANTAFR